MCGAAYSKRLADIAQLHRLHDFLIKKGQNKVSTYRNEGKPGIVFYTVDNKEDVMPDRANVGGRYLWEGSGIKVGERFQFYLTTQDWLSFLEKEKMLERKEAFERFKVRCFNPLTMQMEEGCEDFSTTERKEERVS